MCLPYLHHVFYEDKKITPTPRPGSCHHWHAGATHQRQRYRAPHSAADRRTLYDPEPLCPCHRDRRRNRCRYFSPAGPDHGHRHGFPRHQVQRKDESQSCRQQLEDIFRGKITNWQQVGGDDRKIVVYSRETSSGTYEFFKESVLKNKNYMSSSLSMPATGAIIQSVSQTRGAIGYVGLAYVSPRIKTLAVSYDGQHYAAPTLENAINKTYPIVRPLYYYYNRKNASVIAPLLDFILSAAGQKIIKESGYIPVHNE